MNQKKVGIIVNSAQLYNDSLPMASIGNITFLEYLLQNVADQCPDMLKIFAMGFWDLHKLDDRIKDLASSYGFEFFIGDRDYGARLLRAARHFGLEHVIDVDVLHPLTSLHFCDALLSSHLDSGADITCCHNFAAPLVPIIVKTESLSLYHSMANSSMLDCHNLSELVSKEELYADFMKQNPGYFETNFFAAPLSWQGAGFDPFSEAYMELKLESPESFPKVRNLVYTLNKQSITCDDVVDYMLIVAMRKNWDQETMFDTRYTVVDHAHMSTPEAFDNAAITEIGEFLLNDKKFFGDTDLSAKSILEVGCGMGRLVRVLGGHFGQVCGTDPSAQRYLEARYRMRDLPNVTITQNDGRSLNQYMDNSFDYAFAHGVFVHIHSKQVINNYIDEMGRVLKAAGRCKFDTYLGTEVFGIGPRYFGIGARYTEDEIEGVVSEAGMRVIDIEHLVHRHFERGAEKQYGAMGLNQIKVSCEKL